MDFAAAALLFGKPGILRFAPLGTAEPDSLTASWPTGWVSAGPTDAGSTFAYDVTSANVEVEEEVDVVARVVTGRNAHLTAALATVTYRNLMVAFNGGIVTADGAAWSFEPPDLGDETRIMIGWDNYNGPGVTTGTGNAAVTTYPKNQLRIIGRQAFQGGSVSLTGRKGATKTTIPVDFLLEKPAAGGKLLRIMGAGALNPVNG